MCPIPEKRFLRNNLLDCVHDDVHGLSNKLSDDLRHRAPQHALLQNDHCDFHTWFLKLRHRNASHSQRDALADAKCQDHFDALLLNLRRGDILDDAPAGVQVPTIASLIALVSLVPLPFMGETCSTNPKSLERSQGLALSQPPFAHGLLPTATATEHRHDHFNSLHLPLRYQETRNVDGGSSGLLFDSFHDGYARLTRPNMPKQLR